MGIDKKWLSMRHFLTDAYKKNIYMGQQQYPICNTEIITNGLIENLEYCKIFASPLKRSVQTVEFLLKTYPRIQFEVRYMENLSERCLGEFEGKKKEPIRKNPHFFKNEKFIVTQTPPNGESILSFRKRVNDAVGEIIKEQNKTDILIVSHLQTLRMIRFCITNSYDYDAWHSINYKHGEVVQEDYAQK